jgi:regulator of cell morphogenesis and NO signaling
MNTTEQTSIGEIVSGDFRAAAVFDKFGIDFCCGGKRKLDAVCRERGVSPADVLADLERACGATDVTQPRFADWSCSTLIAYIVDNHHAYVRRAMPAIKAHTDKVARVHGDGHPEMKDVDRIFDAVVAEMTTHMMKEEHILFPYINQLESTASEDCPTPQSPFGTVANPIAMMEQEHESAGDAMARIRELTRGFTPPDDGCTTFRVCLEELAAFERDLHNHVHLENNILFPRALRLERAAR